tara:strand:+ start:1 stop:1230 length:1230 start_codon:yes stop_codon:yes gene_type:complete
MPRRTGGFIGHRGLQAPDPPTAVTPTAGSLSVSVAFTAPSDVGDDAITGFVAQVSTDDTDYSAGSNTGSSSPIVVSSLTAGTAATAKVWAINDYGTSAPSVASASFTPTAAPTALFGGGYTSTSPNNTVESVVITTTANATDHGDLTVARYNPSSFGSATRGLWAAGQNAAGASVNVIDFVLFASTGNATDFGDASTIANSGAGTSNDTRGIYAKGVDNSARTDTIDYVTMASAGNASDFGNLSVARNSLAAGASSAGRGFFAGGQIAADPYVEDTIDYVTIASTGNASDFGNLTVGRQLPVGCASATRGIIAGGRDAGDAVDVIDYITVGSTGNASDFGNLSAARQNFSAASSTLRGVFAGGILSGVGELNIIEYITIASAGNAVDFGDLTAVTRLLAGCSNSHGGIT